MGDGQAHEVIVENSASTKMPAKMKDKKKKNKKKEEEAAFSTTPTPPLDIPQVCIGYISFSY